MTKSISIRVEVDLIDAVDEARQIDHRDRSEVIREALEMWLRQRRVAEQVRRHGDGYEKYPIAEREFAPVLGAQQWPK